jgi:hypothetical protein
MMVNITPPEEEYVDDAELSEGEGEYPEGEGEYPEGEGEYSEGGQDE